MIQRRTWKDHPVMTSEGKALPDGEGVMMPPTPPIGEMSFQGMVYQFSGPSPENICEQAARWLQQNTGKDEIEQLALVVKEDTELYRTTTPFTLTKVGTTVVVSQSSIKPKVYR